MIFFWKNFNSSDTASIVNLLSQVCETSIIRSREEYEDAEIITIH